MAASAKQTVRIVVFVTAVLIALLFAERQAFAEDPAAQAAAPTPDPGGGGATPPEVTTPPPPALPPVTDPPPVATDPAAPPPVVPPIIPGGPTEVPSHPPTPDPTSEGEDDPAPMPSNPSGESAGTEQSADLTTGGTAVANTGGNGANAGVSTSGQSESAQPGPGPGLAFSGTTGTIITGNANGRGSVDENGIHQVVNAGVTENGKVTVVQVAIIVNVGIGIAGSGGNAAVQAAVVSPGASVAMVISAGETATGGSGSGPNPALIGTGNANATGNAGATTVKQSIVLTGDDVASQLASVLNIGVGVANSGLNFALASVSSDNGGGPKSATFVTMGGGSSINTGAAGALGNRSTSTVFQIVTVTASGNGSLLVVQRAIIVNFGLALANTGLNAAGGGAFNAALPATTNAQQLLLMLLDQGPDSGSPSVVGGTLGPNVIATGRAGAVGNSTETGILQKVQGSVTDDEVSRALQDAWVGNFGVALANSGGNGAGGLSGLDASSVGAARDALRAFLGGLTGVGDPLQGLDASFRLGSSLLQLHGDVSGTETLLGVSEPGTAVTADDAAVVIRQVTAVLNIGIAYGDSGHNVALAVSNGHTVGGPGNTVARATIETGDAKAVGSHFAATVCQAVGDALTCAAEPPPPPENPPPENPPPENPPPENPPPQNPPPENPPPPISEPPTVRVVTSERPATLPFTGSPIGAELAAGSALLIAGMLMARRRRLETQR